MTNMEAGREMDALVAEEVFGWMWINTKLNDEQKIIIPPDDSFGIVVPDPEKTSWWWGRDVRELVPEYSTDIADAWQVVEKMAEIWPGASERFVMYKNHGSDEWFVGWQTLAFLRYEPGTTGWVDTDKMEKHKAPMAEANTLPLAICRAALMAVKNE